MSLGTLPYNLQAEAVRLSDVGQIIKWQTGRQQPLPIKIQFMPTHNELDTDKREKRKTLPLIALLRRNRIELFNRPYSVFLPLG